MMPIIFTISAISWFFGTAFVDSEQYPPFTDWKLIIAPLALLGAVATISIALYALSKIVFKLAGML